MAATLTAPGLYLQGTETPPLPLDSAITGFVGVSERGPINSPQPLTGWSDYGDTFGGFVPFGYLAESVFGFFLNGGEKCWVTRAADTSRIDAKIPASPCALAAPLASGAASFVDHTGATSIRISALDPGGWSNRMAVRIATSALRPLRVATLTQPTTAAAMQLTLDSIIDLRPGATIRITDPDGVTNGTDRMIDAGAAALDRPLSRATLTAAIGRVFPIGSVVYAAGFRIEAEFGGRRESFDPLVLRADHPRHMIAVINAPPTMTDYGERRRRGFSSLLSVALPPAPGGFRPADTAGVRLLAGGDDSFTQATGSFPGPAQNALTIVAKGDRGSAGNGLQVVAVPFAAQLALRAAGTQRNIVVDDIRGFQVGDSARVGPPATAQTSVVDVVIAGAMTLQLHDPLTVAHDVGKPVAVANRFTLEARRADAREALEVVRNVGGVASGGRLVSTVLQSATESTLLCANTPPGAFTTPIPALASSASITLSGGVDPGAMDARYYTGYEGDGSYFYPAELAPGTLVGLATLEAVEEISLISMPDLTRVADATLSAAHTSVLRHCARLGDRVALLDAPATTNDTPTRAIEDWALSLGDPSLRTYGAAYHPWVRGMFADREALAPPSGLVAGLIARTDAARGVNKAPANERLKGAFGLQPSVDRHRHGELNPLGVNCIVKLEDGEVRLMGSRTLSDSPVSRYLNVRRTILSVKKTLAQRMLWAVFEPITPALFQRLEATVRTYLQALLARGVTAGQSPDDAFYVHCNTETNPAEQQRLGIVVAEVGIALLAPAEFIVLTARRTPDAVQVIEEEV